MNLKLILPVKKIQLNNKELCIPKLGLKHHKMLKDTKTPSEVLNTILTSIDENLTLAESKIVLFHILEFNGVISTFEYENKTYSVNDIFVVPTPEFSYKNKTYKFRPQKFGETFYSDKELLTTLCTTKEDFGKLPAFVHKWANELRNHIGINLGTKIVYNDQIEELFK